MLYLGAVGSDISPKNHLSRVVLELVLTFHKIWVSSVVQTKAEQMQTHRPFLNALFLIKTNQAPWEVKQYFNRLECAHGRNRADPLSKTRNRTLDLDIIDHYHHARHPLNIDSYLAIPYAEFIQNFTRPTSAHRVELTLLEGLKFGRRPAILQYHPENHLIELTYQRLHSFPRRI